MSEQVYHSHDIQAWEQRRFAQQNSSFGLMQQVAWSIAQRPDTWFQQTASSESVSHVDMACAVLRCGVGREIMLVMVTVTAAYLKNMGYQVEIFAVPPGASADLNQAVEVAKNHQVQIHSHFEISKDFDCHIDALFGIGLNREPDCSWQQLIQLFNAQSGLKVAVDIPSGLNANSGQPLPCAVKADRTFTVPGLKAGLFTWSGERVFRTD